MTISNLIINSREIGPQKPVYIIAEMSANHMQDYEIAVKMLKAAKDFGADAVKLQTYTPDTLTIDCHNKFFDIKGGTPWDGQNLYELYKDAYTPWEWHPKLKKIASDLGIDLFSTPYDKTAVDFLEELKVPVYKVASFELVDIPLLRYIAQTGKPIIMSTGMATIDEINEAVQTIRDAGNNQIALLKCTSAYPASPEDINLKTIEHLRNTFNLVTGLSDHTLETAVPVSAVAIGACIIEKHFTLSRDNIGPDSSFSLNPGEFKHMVDSIRMVEKALGTVSFDLSEKEKRNRSFRRSLFVVKDIKAGEMFTKDNIRSIRPSYGLHTRYYDEILGCKAKQDIQRGTPLAWEMIIKDPIQAT